MVVNLFSFSCVHFFATANTSFHIFCSNLSLLLSFFASLSIYRILWLNIFFLFLYGCFVFCRFCCPHRAYCKFIRCAKHAVNSYYDSFIHLIAWESEVLQVLTSVLHVLLLMCKLCCRWPIQCANKLHQFIFFISLNKAETTRLLHEDFYFFTVSFFGRSIVIDCSSFTTEKEGTYEKCRKVRVL